MRDCVVGDGIRNINTLCTRIQNAVRNRDLSVEVLIAQSHFKMSRRSWPHWRWYRGDIRTLAPPAQAPSERELVFLEVHELHDQAADRREIDRAVAYQFPTVNSVTIPYPSMVRFCCICSAKIVHATQNPRIPRSGCRFDLWNSAFRPITRRPSDLAELSTKRRYAESSVAYHAAVINSTFGFCQFYADDSGSRVCHGKDTAAVRRRHRGVALEGARGGGLHARLPGARALRICGLAQREGGSLPGLGAARFRLWRRIWAGSASGRPAGI